MAVFSKLFKYLLRTEAETLREQGTWFLWRQWDVLCSILSWTDFSREVSSESCSALSNVLLPVLAITVIWESTKLFIIVPSSWLCSWIKGLDCFPRPKVIYCCEP